MYKWLQTDLIIVPANRKEIFIIPKTRAYDITRKYLSDTFRVRDDVAEEFLSRRTYCYDGILKYF